MKRIKLLSVALVIAFAGALHAAARVQGATHAHASNDKPACCKAHKTSDEKAEGHSCDMAGGGCCKSHATTKQSAKASDKAGCDCCDSGCCAHDKKGAQAGTVNAGAQTMSCDASGDCCKDCDCCNAHKSNAAHESAGAGGNDNKSCRAGCSCCGARQSARR